MANDSIANHWIIITNPKSGKRQFDKQKEFITNELTVAKIHYSLFVTRYSGHAVKITCENAEKGYKNFLVLGGDGSISEVVNGIFAAKNTNTQEVTIALIPRGTGNDWGRFWKIKKNDKESLKVFLNGKSRLIDIGKISSQNNDNHYFINSVGFGLDGKVCQTMHQLKKYVGSFSFLYTIGLLITIFKFKPVPAEIIIDGTTRNIRLFTMNIANGPYSGGGIKQNPEAIPYDGIFDMIMVEKPKLKDILTALPLIFNGKITTHPVIFSTKAHQIQIKLQEQTWVEADGVMIQNALQCQVSILPDSIQMIVP